MSDHTGYAVTTPPDVLIPLPSRAELDAVTAERDRLRAAIVAHHSQKADDRCWMDDDALYEAAGLWEADAHVGDKAAMIVNCARFIEKRCAGGKWQSYVELEAERDRWKAAALAWKIVGEAIHGNPDHHVYDSLAEAMRLTEKAEEQL